LDEPLPPGTGWTFTTGSVVMMLVGVQFLTGVGLAMYYVPSPALAYDSLRFLVDDVHLGWLLRALHVWGASFVVVAALLHLSRVFWTGAYKAPREVTWITGVVLLLVIFAFSLSGYLLPWDQKAYWATTVTIGVAQSVPVIGSRLAHVLRGGSELGALTLGRWYAAHVFLLPAAIVAFVVAHIALMRRHGISGPVTINRGVPFPFYPWHAIKDTVAMSTVFAALLTTAWLRPGHLDEIANPADASYVPRPEWYFLSLFQLLKYFPGRFELVATQIVPGLVVGALFALPFLDRGVHRHPWSTGRRSVVLAFSCVAASIAVLTALGLRDAPKRFEPDAWGPQSLAGAIMAEGERATCIGCHLDGGPASPVRETRVGRDEQWLLFHMADPVAIAPGTRPAGTEVMPVLNDEEARAVVAYLRKVRSGGSAPRIDSAEAGPLRILGTQCVSCHTLDGDGEVIGPDLTHVGSRRTAAQLERIISNPNGEYGDSIMPAYGKRLRHAEVGALANYLSTRK